MLTKETDHELIQQVLDGNTQCYAALVKRHERYVFTLAMRFVKSREDAEEVAQDVFVKAYRALGTFKQESKFSTWLYTITYTTAMTALRKKNLITDSIDGEAISVQLENHTSGFGVDQLDRKMGHVYLNEAITALLPMDAAIINLFYQGEQSLEEISKILMLDANTVKVKLHRARHRLREKLTESLKSEVADLLS